MFEETMKKRNLFKNFCIEMIFRYVNALEESAQHGKKRAMNVGAQKGLTYFIFNIIDAFLFW